MLPSGDGGAGGLSTLSSANPYSAAIGAAGAAIAGAPSSAQSESGGEQTVGPQHINFAAIKDSGGSNTVIFAGMAAVGLVALAFVAKR